MKSRIAVGLLALALLGCSIAPQPAAPAADDGFPVDTVETIGGV